jgi:hypothetical protein
VLEGFDLFATDPGTTFVDLGPVTLLPDPVQLQGVPFGPGGTDTIVQRLTTADVSFVGASELVDIELVALHLESVQPVELAPAQFYHLDVFAGSEFDVPQQQGLMRINRDHEHGGTFGAELPVDAQLVFTNIDNPTDVLEFQFSDVFVSNSVWSTEAGAGDPRIVDPQL